MNRSEFDNYLNMYGGDLSKWPTDLQKHAYFYLQNNPSNFEELEFLNDIERELSLRENTNIPHSLVNDIMAQLPEDEAARDSVQRPFGIAEKSCKILSTLSKGNNPAYALVGGLACGIMIGALSITNNNSYTEYFSQIDHTIYTVFYLY